MTNALLLLAGNIPGVPFDYIPNQGAIQAFELQHRMMNVALGLAGLFFLYGVTYTLIKSWEAPVSLTALGKNFVVVALLLSCYYWVFATPLQISYLASQALFAEDDLRALNADIREAAREDIEDVGGVSSTWYGRFFELVAGRNFAAVIATDGVLMLVTIAFYASVAAMMFLWKFFIVVLFAVGPMCIVAGLIGGFGERILAGWVTALIQVSLWQLWFSVCAFFVRTADSFLVADMVTGERPSSMPNHYESIALCAIFTVAHVGTPYFINKLVPISSFSAGVAQGISRGMTTLTGTPTRLIRMGAGGFSRSSKGK